MPILYDRIYPNHLPELAEGEQEDFSRPLQLLAKSLAFIDPITGQERIFDSTRSLLF